MSTAIGTETLPGRPPPPWRNPRFHRATAWRHDRGAGVVVDCRGRRALAAPLDWLLAWHDALVQETGDATAGILTAAGTAWGAADMSAWIARAPEEFGEELTKVHMGVALQTWWWPFVAAGWGRARFDYGRPAQRWLRVDVTGSAVARAVRSARRPVCHLYVGLLAGALGRLSGRALTGVEIQCHACDGGDCRFLITTEVRAAAARDLRSQGVSADEIESRLTSSR